MTSTPAKIKTARLKAKLTQAQAAELVGAPSYRTWQNWERGVNTMPAAEWELFQLKTKSLKCPSCGHHFTLAPKPPKPAPRKGPRRRPMKIEIRPGVVLQILDGKAWIHSINTEEDFQITPADEAKAKSLLPKGVKPRGE